MRFLLVDDDDVLRGRLARALRERGYEVVEAASAAEALAKAAEAPPDRAVVDLRMPGASGLEVVRALCAREPRPRCVVLTGFGTIVSAVEAMRAGAIDYLTKPADADDVLAAFEGKAGDAAREPAEGGEVPTLDRVEWEHIQRVLHDCGGNVSEAARRLGLHRRSLQRKLAVMPPRR